MSIFFAFCQFLLCGLYQSNLLKRKKYFVNPQLDNYHVHDSKTWFRIGNEGFTLRSCSIQRKGYVLLIFSLITKISYSNETAALKSALIDFYYYVFFLWLAISAVFSLLIHLALNFLSSKKRRSYWKVFILVLVFTGVYLVWESMFSSFSKLLSQYMDNWKLRFFLPLLIIGLIGGLLGFFLSKKK